MSILKIKIQRKIRPTEAEDKLVPQNNNLCFYLSINQITTIFDCTEEILYQVYLHLLNTFLKEHQT